MAYIQQDALHSGTRETATRDQPGGRFDADVVVVGAGLAGLTAAAFAARAGASVVVLERAGDVGGRAATHENDGFLFNAGPHALYDGGHAARALADLGVRYSGRRPPASGGLAYHGGSLHALPAGFVSLLTTDLLSLSGKLELGKVLGSLGKIDAAALEGQTLRRWLDTTFRDGVVRGLVEALMRVTAYANDPDRSCAAASVAQLQAGLGKGVLYLDGGWTTLAGGLGSAAEDAGAVVRTGQRVRSVRTHRLGADVVVGAGDGPGENVLRARVVVLAVPPAVAAGITQGEGSATLAAWARDAKPVKAACLDLGLRRLPDPRRLFVVGIDRPLYFSVHSASAKLAPEGGAVIHVAMYLPPGEHYPKAAKATKAALAELEAFCDVVQPGWRREEVARRYLPSMMVTGALVEVNRPRPGPEVAEGLLVAGDWVGSEGMIADTAVASGRRAGVMAAVRAASMAAVKAASMAAGSAASTAAARADSVAAAPAAGEGAAALA